MSNPSSEEYGYNSLYPQFFISGRSSRWFISYYGKICRFLRLYSYILAHIQTQETCQRINFAEKQRAFWEIFRGTGDIKYDRIEIVLVRKGSEKDEPAHL